MAADRLDLLALAKRRLGPEDPDAHSFHYYEEDEHEQDLPRRHSQ